MVGQGFSDRNSYMDFQWASSKPEELNAFAAGTSMLPLSTHSSLDLKMRDNLKDRSEFRVIGSPIVRFSSVDPEGCLGRNSVVL